MSDLVERARAWLALDPDPDTASELTALLDRGDTAALAERFEGTLEFGTAGIRGILGAGPMRLNRLVVRRVSAGLADYVLTEVHDAARRGVVVGYDGRRNSRVFAEDAARVFLARGLTVHLAVREQPTPVVAFAVLDRDAAAGAMITASHNPPEYNGYKVYWDNGAQIIPPHDDGIAEAIAEVDLAAIELADLDAARASGKLVDLGDDVEARYLAGVRDLAVHPESPRKAPTTVAYTPLHGVGARFVEQALRSAGHTVTTEPSQREPDGEFPTVRFPNPEEQGAMDRVLALAGEVGADLVLANDPDADRLAVALPDNGGFRMLTGDQIGVLLADYLLEDAGGGPRMVATTIVSSSLLRHMAEARKVDFRETLTGFKWIANAAIDWTDDTGGEFVMGYEEALGYSVGSLVRDKDGVSAAALFAEMSADARRRGTTVAARLEDIYRRYGLFSTEQVSLVLPGTEGLARIRNLMQRFRDESPSAIGGVPVVERHDVAAGALGLPKANVLVFRLEGSSRVIMRPSGTEPKLKSYYEVREPLGEGTLDEAVERARERLAALRDAHQAELAAAS